MGKRLGSLDELDFIGEVGDWCFSNNDQYLWLRYPDAGNPERGEVIHLYIKAPGTENPATPCWDWDGNKEAPTISPSIKVGGFGETPELWHGFLREGKLVNA